MVEEGSLTPKRSLRQKIVRIPEELFGTLYERTANEPVAWRLTAWSLLRAARALIPLMDDDLRAMLDPSEDHVEHPVTQIFMLLSGLAIENLAKAKVVAESESSVTDDGKLTGPLKSHGLVELLDRAGLTLSEEEAYLAQRLQAFVEWAGRYPIATKVEDQLPRAAPGGGWGPLSSMASSDIEAIDALVGRLAPQEAG